mmetsp:Transcript_49722/g.60120  ORF Transcript_49722/g.60120 Transcript_49722/m.60120 type:complete len:99 (-) Transcript_49722:214-510(-)
MNLMYDDLHYFWRGPYQLYYRDKLPPPSSPSIQRRINLAEAFKKGIKRNTSSFPILNNSQGNDNWNRVTCAQTLAQGYQEVLDSAYVPIGGDKSDLFE